MTKTTVPTVMRAAKPVVIEVRSRAHDLSLDLSTPSMSAVERHIVETAHSLGFAQVCRAIRTTRFVFSSLPDALDRTWLGQVVLSDSVVETASFVTDQTSEPSSFTVGLRPGVTDATANAVVAVLREECGDSAPDLRVAVQRRIAIEPALGPAELHRLAVAVSNDTVEHFAIGTNLSPGFDEAIDSHAVELVSLTGLDADALQSLSRSRVLSLDVNEMCVIQAEFDRIGRAPTDAELETLAQTWSEHCNHKTFRAQIDFTHTAADGAVIAKERIDGLLKTYLRSVTEELNAPWVRSSFVDNAGIVAFSDTHDLAIKVETHNHPSALEPFGGANTGVGGVVRDVIGVSARPIAAIDVLCFAPPDLAAERIPEGVLHPRRIRDGVVEGIGDYGNKLGLPTVAGAVVYDDDYVANPLVYCGAVGLLPRGSHPRDPRPGDRIVVLGGATGRDGIHGATFSSAEMTVETAASVGSVVQIGDPITEKGLIEVIEVARDRALYTAITDCGAGGLSSAVGELAAEHGAVVDLAFVPRKYAGLAPWEVWLSEAQERMVLSVSPSNVEELVALCHRWRVEAHDIGEVTSDHHLRVRDGQTPVIELPMEFLHDGCPRRSLIAEWIEPAATDEPQRPDDLSTALLALLSDPSVASKEDIIRTYDHEVRGGTVVRPTCGPHDDGPTDGAAFVPLGEWDARRGIAIGIGINPRFGRRDPYRMGMAAVDEAVRNAVCMGADPDQLSLLDNFCWGRPTVPERLGSLVRATQACADAARAYRAPFVSGKDSLSNEYEGRAIPGTLLITALGVVPDVSVTVTSALRAAGNALVLIGTTHDDELGASLLATHQRRTGGVIPGPLHDPLPLHRLVHHSLVAGRFLALHDVSEGGIAVALAEMAIAGRLGIEATASTWQELFAESNGRYIAEVAMSEVIALREAGDEVGVTVRVIGAVTSAPSIAVRIDDEQVIDLALRDAVRAFKGCAS